MARKLKQSAATASDRADTRPPPSPGSIPATIAEMLGPLFCDFSLFKDNGHGAVFFTKAPDTALRQYFLQATFRTREDATTFKPLIEHAPQLLVTLLGVAVTLERLSLSPNHGLADDENAMLEKAHELLQILIGPRYDELLGYVVDRGAR